MFLPLLTRDFFCSDHEIFRLKDEVESSEGKDATFYDFLGITPSATQDEINKAYRKMSRQIHPDKARQSYLATYIKPTPTPKSKSKTNTKKPGVTVHKQPTAKELSAFNKAASERFARLGIVANILRGGSRQRYDHFLQNGFPAWRGTGYYYSRFRPGLGSVLIGLFVFGGGAAHYGAMYLGWKRQRDFVERYIRHARRMAWGNEVGIPGVDDGAAATATAQDAGGDEVATAWNRKERRRLDRENKKERGKDKDKKPKATPAEAVTPPEPQSGAGPQGAKKRVEAPNGKVLIVDSLGDVYLEENTKEGDRHVYLLDVGALFSPGYNCVANMPRPGRRDPQTKHLRHLPLPSAAAPLYPQRRSLCGKDVRRRGRRPSPG